MQKFLNIILMIVSFSALAQDIENPSFFRDVLPETVENMGRFVGNTFKLTGFTVSICSVIKWQLRKKYPQIPPSHISNSNLVGITTRLFCLACIAHLASEMAREVQCVNHSNGRNLTPKAIELRDNQAHLLEISVYTTLATTFFLRRAK